MPIPISDAFRQHLASLILNSDRTPDEQLQMLVIINRAEGTKTMTGVRALSEFIARTDVRGKLAAYTDDLTRVTAYCSDAQALRRQVLPFADESPFRATSAGAMIGAMAGHLKDYPHIDYEAHQADYFLRHYQTFLEEQRRAAATVDLASPKIEFFTGMNEARRSTFVVDIDAIQNDPKLIGAAKEISVAMLELNGGLGSSIGLDPSKHHSKATGIMIPALLDTPEGPQEVELSIMEAKLRQLSMQVASFRELHVFPLNSTITNNGWSTFLTSPSLETRIGRRNDSATNLAIFKESGLIFRSEVLQKGFPKIRQTTLDPIETGDPDTETAPGGHGQILFELYYSGKLRKLMDYGVQVLVIGNADGKQARPHPAIVAKMVEDSIPAALISTDRTAIDAKGGIFAVDNNALGIIERSQVDKSQLKLFESIGLREDDAPQPFNTNTVYINIPLVLSTLTSAEVMEGPEAVRQFLMPTTIANKKTVRVGGEEVPVYQMEGAIASVILKFPGAKIFNAAASDRWTQFTPVKGPADVVYLFRSDVFALDAVTGGLVPQVANPIPPTMALEGWKGWEQLPATIEAFGRPSMKALKSLSIRGAVLPTNAIFRGRVEIASELQETVYLNNSKYAAKLPREHGKILLADVRVTIDAHGVMTVERLGGGTAGGSTPAGTDHQEARGANSAPETFSGIEFLPEDEGQTEAPEGDQTIEGALQFVAPGQETVLPTTPAAPVAPVAPIAR